MKHTVFFYFAYSLVTYVLFFQYDKTRKPYDGRASLDRRRPALVGRQSQDNRFFNKGDQSRDQKTRAAGQAAHNAGTSSRKHQTLSTVGSSATISF